MINKDENDIQNQYFAAKESLDMMSVTSGMTSGSYDMHALNSLSHSMDPSPTITIKKKNGMWSVPEQSNGDSAGNSDDDNSHDDNPQTWKEKFVHFYAKEGLLIEVLMAILLARAYPKLGAIYLFPEVTAHWIAVIIIFFLSGFALRIEQLSAAASHWKFNAFVILYNFIGISCVVNFVAKFFYANEIVSEDLMKGMIICSCLSMPTNMMVVLSISSKGDEAVALFLATVMNLMGVFVTPLLIFLYLQENAEIDFVNTYKTISLRVLLPVAVGIITRKKVEGADEFATENRNIFLKLRERCLVYIVYATFCTTFMTETDSTRIQICVMALSQVILLSSSMVIAWVLLFIFFNRKPKLRVVGLFGCSTKTAALGIPLISAIYEDSPRLGIYTMPLLVWYPMQLIIGTVLAPRMSTFVDYKLNKYEMERRTRQFDGKACGLLGQPSWMDGSTTNQSQAVDKL